MAVPENYFTQMDLRLNVEIQNKKYGTVIILDGVLTNSTLKIAQNKFMQVISLPGTRMGLDLSNLEYVDSKGLAVLMQLADQLTRKKIPMYAFGMNKDILTILECVDFHGELNLLQDEKEFKDVG